MARRDPLAARCSALEALAKATTVPDVAEVRRGLTDRASLVVAAAARVVTAHRLEDLATDVAAALDRHYQADDPQCRAKHACLSTLIALREATAEQACRAAAHRQPEPVWGGTQDSAGPLRILGLEALAAEGRAEVFSLLADLLGDDLAEVRSAAAKVAGDLGGERAALLLRLRLRLGDDDEPANIGDYAAGLLAISGDDAVPLVRDLLEQADRTTAGPLALALGASRLPTALPVLLSVLDRLAAPLADEDLVTAIALHRSERAAACLLDLLEDPHRARLAAAELRLYRDRENVMADARRRVGGRMDLLARLDPP